MSGFKEILAGEPELPERIDELDDLDSDVLIDQFRTELPNVYEANLAKCKGGIINNNFLSDRDIKWIIRQNREEAKFNEQMADGKKIKEFLDSSVGQRFLQMK